MFTLLIAMCFVTPDVRKPGQPSFECVEVEIQEIKKLDECKALADQQEMIVQKAKGFSLIQWGAQCIISI